MNYLLLFIFVQFNNQNTIPQESPLPKSSDVYSRKSPPISLNQLLKLWNDHKIYFLNYAKMGTRNDPSCYYNLQQYLSPLSEAAFKYQNKELIHDLINIIELSYGNLKSFGEIQNTSMLDKKPFLNKYSRIAGDEVLNNELSGATSETRTWFNEKRTKSGSIYFEEIRLNNFQYLFFICRFYHLITTVPKMNRTDQMNEFLKHSNLFITKDQLLRNIYIAKYSNWQDLPKVNGFTELSLKLNYKRVKHNGTKGPEYFNAVLDRELWLIASTAEWIAANACDSFSIQLSKEDKKQLIDYVQLGSKLIQSRITFTTASDFQNQTKRCAIFDAGVWKTHPENKFAFYESIDFPSDTLILKNVEGLGWDFSHASRFPWVFSSLYECKQFTQCSFPTKEVMEEMSNQLAYVVFNKDLKKPLFKNYMDGSNGWFRVNYADRKHFGYGPYGQTNAILNGSRMKWINYNKDVLSIFQSVYEMLYSNDDEIIQFRNEHYKDYTNTSDSLWFIRKLQFESAITIIN